MCGCLCAVGQVKLDSAGRNSDYVKAITERSMKIVDGLKINDDNVRNNVLNIICNRYFKLNDIYEKNKDRNAIDAELYKHHFEFAADLANYVNDAQIEAIKDGMTYGVVPKTYKAHLEMIPGLKENEKLQILNWLKEAREFAIDASDSKSKHAWFGKYKGRINNWLATRGYDLKSERDGWYKRIEAAKKQK
ncbi:MAG: DUF3826 domain-containing protein [Prevotella sp.]|nr:DUF3826 domain-containing protein [Prevotella sp.]